MDLGISDGGAVASLPTCLAFVFVFCLYSIFREGSPRFLDIFSVFRVLEHWTFVLSLNILSFGALHRREVEKGPPFVPRPWGVSSMYSQTFL